MKLIDDEFLDKLSKEARASSRLRMNFNFHESLDAKAQRLLNAIEPGSVVPPHRHKHTAETYIVLRGSLKVYIYESDGSVKSEHILDPCEGKYGIEIPAGVYHNLEVIDRNTVIFEAKEGPYIPVLPEDVLIR